MMIKHIRTIKILLTIYLKINLLCAALIIVSMYIKNECNPVSNLLVVNIFDLILYGIATALLLFFGKVELLKSKNNEILSDEFLALFSILIFTYLFWHCAIFFIIFAFFDPMCYWSLWFFLRLGCDALLIIYSIVCMILCYLIKRSIRKYVENKLEMLGNAWSPGN